MDGFTSKVRLVLSANTHRFVPRLLLLVLEAAQCFSCVCELGSGRLVIAVVSVLLVVDRGGTEQQGCRRYNP